VARRTELVNGFTLSDRLTHLNELLFENIVLDQIEDNLSQTLQGLSDSLALNNIDDFLSQLRNLLNSISSLTSSTVELILESIRSILESVTPSLPDTPPTDNGGILDRLEELLNSQLTVTTNYGPVTGELVFVGNDYIALQETTGGLTYILPSKIQMVDILGEGGL
jgi:hypothetical protein